MQYAGVIIFARSEVWLRVAPDKGARKAHRYNAQ